MFELSTPGIGMVLLAVLVTPYWILHVRYYWQSAGGEQR